MNLIKTLIAAALACSSLAGAATIQLTQEGWSSGGRLNFEFLGQDVNNDGAIDQFELSSFSASYESPVLGIQTSWGLNDIQPDSFLFTDLGNYLFFVVNPSYSLINTAFEGEALASIFDANLFPVDSTSTGPSEVPEPSSFVLLAIGSAMLVLGSRRVRLKSKTQTDRNPNPMTSSKVYPVYISTCALLVLARTIACAQSPSLNGKTLFEKETFGGNGRTCLTCHSSLTGTLSPQEAQKRFIQNRFDPLFLHDGSDDGRGNGTRRMLTEATILVTLPLPANVSLADDPNARTVTLRRGISSTLNTPALDKVLMLDGREANLTTQARSAINDHAQGLISPTEQDLQAIADFQLTDGFFSSQVLRNYAHGGPAPVLPQGQTESEKRGRTFFEEKFDPTNLKLGACAACHAGPMLNQTSKFFPLAPAGSRFETAGVSELNSAHNPVRTFVFRQSDGTPVEKPTPDPGRALITGDVNDLNNFKIASLWGAKRTAPYFHDNSARTLEDLVEHYAKFFKIAIKLDFSAQDKADIVAYMKFLE